MLSDRQALLVLNALPTMGPVLLNRLLEGFGRDPLRILAAPRDQLLSIKGVGPVTAEAIRDWRSLFDLEREEARIRDSGITLLTWLDDAYPDTLRQIPDPPIALYLRGSLPSLQPQVAIVGTRNPTHHGSRIARQLARDLASAGITVISGLARGIDAAAHHGSLDGGGPTIGVIGSGMGTIFPPEHADLYRSISENGGVLSEFPFSRPPDKQTFPIRNRVVAGLARAVVVVESTGTGGAMITAQFAGDYGRLLFAIPGRLDDRASEGPHRLIREGAILCRTAADILEDLLPQHPPLQGELPLPNSTNSAAAALSLRIAAISDPKARAVAQALLQARPCNVDALTEATALPAWELQSHLLTLELEGLLRKNLNGTFDLI